MQAVGAILPSVGLQVASPSSPVPQMTFLLVVTVYAAAVSKPGMGNTAPLAIGLSLYAAAISGRVKMLGMAWLAEGKVAHLV